ncbi:unnamed protein product [Gordionus sp. m RMFG-2023]|uniref:short transient receptor potential channel 7-like isoform X1 n=1 Tax=Gordionus sp. m RMFG-2023 TaxID=3053472 RepID=UPI0030E2E608
MKQPKDPYSYSQKIHDPKLAGKINQSTNNSLDPENNLHERLSHIIFGDASLTEIESRYLSAAEKGDQISLHEILQENPGLNLNCVDYLGRSALQLAVLEEQIDVIDFLIPRMQLQRVGEAWLHAIDKGNLAICEQILQHPFHRNTLIRNQLLGNDSFFSTETENLSFSADMSPIILAAQRNNVKLIQLLLANGAIIPRPHIYDCKCISCSNQRKFDSVRHSHSRLNAYKGLASQAYISLSSNDPLNTAFELSKELADLSKVEKEFKIEYVKLSNQCKDYSVVLENLCRSTDELLTILKGKSTPKPTNKFIKSDRDKNLTKNIDAFNADEIDGSELNMLKIAIKTKQKKFISHPSCQQQLSIFWYRGFTFWQHCNSMGKIAIVFLIGIFIPLLALGHYILPIKQFRRFLQSPIIKFMMHAMSHVIFLILLGLLSVRNDQLFRQMLGLPPLATYSNDNIKEELREAQYLYFFGIIHLLVVLWVIGYLVTEVNQIFNEGPANYLTDWWNYLHFNLILLYFAAYATLFTIYFKIYNTINFTTFQDFLADIESRNGKRSESLETPVAIFNVFFSLANVMSFMRMAYFLPANEQVGPLQISLGRMMEDIVKFGFIFVLVLTAFICGMTNLYGMYSIEGSNHIFTSLQGTFGILFWSTFGMGDPSAPKFDNKSRIFIQNSGYILYGMYTATSLVVLVNMLIAMMTDSFQQIKDDEDVEWKYARSKLWMSFIQEREYLPIPFNLIPSLDFLSGILFALAEFVKHTSLLIMRKVSLHSGANDPNIYNRNREMGLTNGLNRENKRDGIIDDKYDIMMRKIIRRYLHAILYSRIPQNEGDTIDIKYGMLKQANEKIKSDISELKGMLTEFRDNKYSSNNSRRSSNIKGKDLLNIKL